MLPKDLGEQVSGQKGNVEYNQVACQRVLVTAKFPLGDNIISSPLISTIPNLEPFMILVHRPNSRRPPPIPPCTYGIAAHPTTGSLLHHFRLSNPNQTSSTAQLG